MVNIGLGSVFPLYRSATGRVFAAFLAPEVIRDYLALGDNVDQRATSHETVEQVRRRGLARAEGDFMAGMSAFAAPVLDDRGRLVVAMTVLGYKANFDERWASPIAAALRASADRLSLTLGYEGARAPR
jgi:DNA-binding IclR family transcriptional regulator